MVRVVRVGIRRYIYLSPFGPREELFRAAKLNHTTLVHCLPKLLMLSVTRRTYLLSAQSVVQMKFGERDSRILLYFIHGTTCQSGNPGEPTLIRTPVTGAPGALGPMTATMLYMASRMITLVSGSEAKDSPSLLTV